MALVGLGVSGGIGAYKAVEVARGLRGIARQHRGERVGPVVGSDDDCNTHCLSARLGLEIRDSRSEERAARIRRHRSRVSRDPNQ